MCFSIDRSQTCFAPTELSFMIAVMTINIASLRDSRANRKTK